MPPLPLSRTIAQIATGALDRKSAQLGQLLGQWEIVAGQRLGSISYPVALRRRKTGDRQVITLEVAVPAAWGPEFRHESARLIARINAFFGFEAISALRLMPHEPRVRPKKTASSRQPENPRISAAIDKVADPELRAVLASFDAAMRGGKKA